MSLCTWCSFGAFVLLPWGGVCAEELLNDPTRPPSFVDSANGGGLAGSGGRLSSIVLPQTGKPSAVIDGQVVVLGQKLGEARLVRVSEASVVLKGPEGVEKLYLTPDVKKQEIVTKGVAMDRSRSKKDRP